MAQISRSTSRTRNPKEFQINDQLFPFETYFVVLVVQDCTYLVCNIKLSQLQAMTSSEKKKKRKENLSK